MVDRRSRVVFICSALLFLLFGRTVEQQISLPRQERLALIQLRSSLGLRAREWPIKSDPCASWVGIRCTGGRVTGINISGFRRTRRGSQNPQFSVDALRNLTLLSSFNASNFAVPGPIPEWLGLQFDALQVLDLRSCSINGSIPPTLGNLSSLIELYLSHNNLTGMIPSSVTQLTGLNVLDLSQNMLRGQIPAASARLRNLTLLDLSSNFLSGPIPSVVGTFSNLLSLNLSRNNFSSLVPTQLGGLSSLVDLDLGFNLFSGPLPSELGGLSNLRHLMMGSNLLTGQLPDVLWSMQDLQFLDVSVNNFTGTLPTASPPANNASTSVLNISQNWFYGSITPLITRFSFVDMSGNYFQGPVPIYARGNTSLDRNCLRNSTAQRSLVDCASFYAARNLVFDNFGQTNTSQISRPSRSHRSVIILASIFGAVGLIGLVLLIAVLLIVCKRKRAHTSQRGVVSVGPIPAGGESPPPPGASLDISNLGDAITYQKILQATGEFNESKLLKSGHTGDFFCGVIDGGVPVVVKKFELSSSVKKEAYVAELELFSKISHPRLVPLIGHCLEKEDEKFLVYRHMLNGDLSSSLFRKVGPDGSLQPLDWITRLKIAIGAAEGLSYLHHECNPPLVHRDVQASSILLDDKFEVRLGSLSGVCTQESDTHQSRITKFLRLPQSSDLGTSGTPNATCAYDVYCFGKVLLELVTGNLGISSPSADPATTKEWLDATLRHVSIYDKDIVNDILDPSMIIDEDLLEEVWAMAIVARSCLNPRPNRRPIMRYILKALENPLKVVRDEQQHTSSERLRTASSRGSWNAALFGSWRHSSSDVAAQQAAVVAASMLGNKLDGTSGSQGSGLNGDGNNNINNSNSNNNGNSSSARKSLKDIFPEPLEEGVI